MLVNSPNNAFGVKWTLNIKSFAALRWLALLRLKRSFRIPKCLIGLHEAMLMKSTFL